MTAWYAVVAVASLVFGEDAASGQIDAGEIRVADLLELQPWGALLE